MSKIKVCVVNVPEKSDKERVIAVLNAAGIEVMETEYIDSMRGQIMNSASYGRSLTVLPNTARGYLGFAYDADMITLLDYVDGKYCTVKLDQLVDIIKEKLGGKVVKKAEKRDRFDTTGLIVTTITQGHFTMVQVTDAMGRIGVGFSKWNPEDAKKHYTINGERVYEIKQLQVPAKNGKMKPKTSLIAVYRKPFLYNKEIGYKTALARAIRAIGTDQFTIETQSHVANQDVHLTLVAKEKPAKERKARARKPVEPTAEPEKRRAGRPVGSKNKVKQAATV